MILFVFPQEREMMQAHFQELKGQMNKLREDERERLTKLTLDSNNTLKELQKKCEKVYKHNSNCIHKHPVVHCFWRLYLRFSISYIHDPIIT